MAEARFEEIYQDALVITHLKEAVRLLHVGDEASATEIWEQQMSALKRIGEKFNQLTEKAGDELMRITSQVTGQMRDPIAFADALEENLLPMLQAYMKAIGHIRVEDGDYVIESSVSGYLSLYHTKTGSQIHGLFDPMESARVMAESIYRSECGEYCLLGAGLGYLAYQIYLISGKTAKIRIYETDRKIHSLAECYGVLGWISKENLYIEKRKDILLFLRYLDEHDARCDVPEWALSFLPKQEADVVIKVYTGYAVERNVKDTNYAINFWKNRERKQKFTTDIPREGLKEDFIVVAAGPSLDQTIDFLTESRDSMTVIAVGTVFRKLLKLGIIPDFVAILESHKNVYAQFQGLEEQTVPLIAPMSAYWKLAECYQGEIYFFPDAGCDESCAFARENGMDTWAQGSTVALTAIEATARLGAKNVYLIGLDLAYPGGVSHAKDTPQYKKMSEQEMSLVEKVGGGKVYSSYVFSLFREQIEELIQIYRDVKFYNLSREGSQIKGTIELNI